MSLQRVSISFFQPGMIIRHPGTGKDREVVTRNHNCTRALHGFDGPGVRVCPPGWSEYGAGLWIPLASAREHEFIG